MKPAAFAYHRPESRAQALALLAEHGDEAKIISGGQSLVPAMNFRLARPPILIDINAIPGMDEIREEGGIRPRHRACQDVDTGHHLLLARATPRHGSVIYYYAAAAGGA